ncbi:NnrU family protein [Ramlibacter sp. WS9]|uniref:NnrU family protein n=1 Tax=Ramlibacter sp. WS9 TaxID=1882741 RepID=UPI0011432051|nr:NnrU family protein [Ramlibacter sp. WS9]ROZ66224.1 protein NrnU [Ramlibacter sp. WS9]
MLVLILGLALFLGVHSTRIFADGWRTQMVARMGPLPWKGLYAVVSIASFIVIVWGFRMARRDTLVLYATPPWTVHVTALLMVLAMILFVAAYIPRNWFKAKFHHPQVLSVKTWAVAHLLSNGEAANVVLFVAFLLWAALSFRAARQRDRANNTVYAPANAIGTSIAVAAGLVAWSVFALLLHGPLIGVRPLGY